MNVRQIIGALSISVRPTTAAQAKDQVNRMKERGHPFEEALNTRVEIRAAHKNEFSGQDGLPRTKLCQSLEADTEKANRGT